MALLGYTRVSTKSQDAQLQRDALTAAGVQEREVFADVTSGSKNAITRPGMIKLLEYARDGDSVVVWRIDRLGRSLIDVLNTVNLLQERGLLVPSISDGIDPATSTGRLMLNMLAPSPNTNENSSPNASTPASPLPAPTAPSSDAHQLTRIKSRRSSRSPTTPEPAAVPRPKRPASSAGAAPPSTDTTALACEAVARPVHQA